MAVSKGSKKRRPAGRLFSIILAIFENMKKFISFFLVTILLASCIAFAGIHGTAPSQIHPWWQDAIFYEVFVRSFNDSNGDGIGDFNGITKKLDYLKDLGITALWLMPIFPSPSYHGYDVTDYFNANPQYGTLEDFKNLLSQAHQRGMHVIIDMVYNHTSDQNPWFVSANEDPQSPYRNWYIWSSTNPAYMGPLGVAWHPGKQGFYYAVYTGMPDLNYRNPAVTTEMNKVTSFWLKNIGVDGFRLDSIMYLIEEGQKQKNTKSTHDWLKKFYQTYKADNPIAFMVGEVGGADAALAATYTGDQLDMAFEFELATSFINSVNGGSNSSIDSALSFAQQSLPTWQFASFLTNHDQPRTMTVLNGNVDKAKVAAFLLLTSPGTPFIYYGEEIGMEGDKPDPNIRTPMQWTDAAGAGFTSGMPWESLGPNYQTANVAAELNDPNSLLSFYHSMIAIHKQHPALRYGDLVLLSTGNPGVYGALRGSSSETLLILVNLTKSPIQAYDLSATGVNLADGKYTLTALVGNGTAPTIIIQKGAFADFKPAAEMPAFSTYLYKLTP